ncbi:RcnB family protein [Sphingobium mellinum]|uniref:RcnB family protein n=1 Tax=Sphingobium mellinum TaxID=1387166 RepID=UPI0030EF26C6
MRFRNIMLGSVALGLAAPGLATGTTPMGSSTARSFSTRPVHDALPNGAAVRRWGAPVQGRWFAGWYAPGGWAAYRRPALGYVLPTYWMSPAYRIQDYPAYGLPAPPPGYGWSRYYDDAVMTDGDGHVRDQRHDMDWGKDGSPPSPTIGYDDDVTAPDGPPPHEFEGRWTGSWRDENGRVFNGEYQGRFEGDVRSSYGADYDAPPYALPSAAATAPIVHQSGPGAPVVTTTQAPGHYAGGYYFPGATTTTIVVQPAVTTTKTYVTESVSRPRRHKRK